MDVGTAKPSLEERAQAPHHLLDLLNPDQTFSLGHFLAQARRAMAEIRKRGKLPLVVGGTGQYVWALLEGWEVPEMPPDEDFRRGKEQEAKVKGGQALHNELQRIDPQRAGELDPRNLRRVIRALEIFHATGQRPSETFPTGTQRSRCPGGRPYLRARRAVPSHRPEGRPDDGRRVS